MLIEGQHLGEFEVLEQLGQGGMGTVFKARQASLHRFVALKTLKPLLSGDDAFVARFHQEAVAAAALNHSNLVHVYSAGKAEGIHYIAMEFVEGESALKRLAREGRMEPAIATAIAIHVANALGYAWQRARIIHRDIKPDNIFLSADGEVKLGDLGLAKNVEETQSLTVTGASMGTPHYISPEQAEGRKDIDLRADIYSLGCTLYHLLTGKTPYQGSNIMAVMMKQISAPPPDIRQAWPECPPALAAAITRMLQKDPAARYQNYDELIADLRRAQDQLAAARVPRLPDRKPILAWAVGGAAVLAIIAGAIFWTRQDTKTIGAPDTIAARTPSVALANPAPVAPAAATKDRPFENTLGMKFVPAPGTTVLFSIWDTRIRDYAAYARVNKVDGSWQTQPKDGLPVSREPNDPVVGVSWEDAQAFCQWLTEKESAEGKLPKGMKYRLPTDEEWSIAAGLPPEQGATPAEKSGRNTLDFPWGIGFPPPEPNVGNYADESFHAKFPPNENAKEAWDKNRWIEGYSDGYAMTSPVGSFPANAYGLYDIGGNVYQWCEDWFDASHKDRALRGAAWGSSARSSLLLSNRSYGVPTHRYNGYGFRCVLAPVNESPAPIATPATATKDSPFENTLGMKFVPVAGTKVLFSIWDTRVQDYAAYAGANKADDAWTKQQRDGEPVGRELNHPVVAVTWDEAQAFCKWLTEKETAEGKLPKGVNYRLPTDEEWSWAVGLPPELGATPAEKWGKNSVDFPWGKDYPPPAKVGNYADEAFHAKFPLRKNEKENRMETNPWIEGYNDGYATTSPVGSFPANACGLHDMGGNVWQWCGDWFDASHIDCLLRGASWDNSGRGSLLSSGRHRSPPTLRGPNYGFRCVLDPAAQAGGGAE